MGALKSQFIAQFLRLQPNWLAREDQRIPVVVEHNVVGVDAIADEVKKCCARRAILRKCLQELHQDPLYQYNLCSERHPGTT